MSAPLYEFSGVEACYDSDGRGGCVLRVPRLSIARGSILGLVGHNGSGKSTLLKVLGFLLAPTAGEFFFDGRLVDRAAWRAGHALRRRAVLLGQDTCLLKRSVAANVAYGLTLRGLPVTERAVAEALALVGLDSSAYAKRPWRQLSGGEARRVALAARLILRPEALLLDEPTTGLDRASTAHVKDAALSARAHGATIVIASHEVDWLSSIADRVLTLEEGRIVGEMV